MESVRLPRELVDGDCIALVAPASWLEPEDVEQVQAVVESWGFRAVVGAHALRKVGFLAGTDEERLADLNDAVRDPEVRAIMCLRGGCGNLRLLRGVDVEALRADPKPVIGFSDITALHRVWHHHGVSSLHGAAAGAHRDSVNDVLRGKTPPPLGSDAAQFGVELTTSGCVTGTLFGGNLEMLARSVGVLPFNLQGHVLLLEINRSAGLGHVDRALTQLLASGALDGVVGVALGWLSGFEGYVDRDWTVLDVLRDHLDTLNVPVLAGLPFGHGPDPQVAALGMHCVLDADAGLLTGSAAMRR